MSAKELRARARQDLSGRWIMTLLLTLLAALLGGSVGLFRDAKYTTTRINIRDSQFFHPENLQNVDISAYKEEVLKILVQMMPFIMGATTVMIIFGLIRFCIGAFISLGLIQYNIDMVDGKEPDAGVLLSKTSCFAQAFFLRLRGCIQIFLWSLLLIIPGIIKSYAYHMAGFIAAENPDISSKEALRVSCDMMKGYKLRLFFLQLSFIGWDILTVFTFGLGNLWLTPYKNAATAEFYNMVSREYQNGRA